ncbi:MAG: NTPase [Candidatus Njordarchaeota archaeon]
MIKNIFLTGKPGSGKSTLLIQIAEELRTRGLKIKGIICPEIRIKGKRWGFKVIVYPTGEEEILASIKIKTGPKISKYGVNISGFEKIGVKALSEALEDPNIDIIIIDEIGKMELLSEKFIKTTRKILNSPKITIGVLGMTPHPLVKEIRTRQDTIIINIKRETTPKERNQIKKKIIETILKNKTQKQKTLDEF